MPLPRLLHPPPNKDIQGASCQVGGFRVYDSSLTPAGVKQGVNCHSALEGGAAAAAGGGTAAAEGAGGESGAGGGAGKGPEILAQPEAQTESESASAGTVAESASATGYATRCACTMVRGVLRTNNRDLSRPS